LVFPLLFSQQVAGAGCRAATCGALLGTSAQPSAILPLTM